MLRFFKYLLFFCLTLALLLTAAVGGGLYYLVVVNPGPEIEEANIEAILGRESPVLYSDGQEKIGVLFQGFHRQYLVYDQIPKKFINALVAAEDNRFFQHSGIDIAGIARAMIANFKAGRIVQGGSTLTQQTAKNLFKRESRSYQAKLKELLYALRLEHHYGLRPATISTRIPASLRCLNVPLSPAVLNGPTTTIPLPKKTSDRPELPGKGLMNVQVTCCATCSRRE